MPRLQLTHTTLGENYHLTIPRKFVKKMGWKKGDRITIDERSGHLILYKK